MSFTYDSTMPADLDTVRFLVQDTDPDRQLFQDEEINWMLTQEANIYMAAAGLCDTLVAKAGGVRYKKIGDLSIGFDPKFYRSLSNQFRARGMSHQVPYAGGIDVADKTAQAENTGSTQPSVFRRLDDNQQALQPEQPLPSNPLTVI